MWSSSAIRGCGCGISPFAIGARERDEWLWCMDRALAGHPMSEELRSYLMQRMHQLAEHMRNQPE